MKSGKVIDVSKTSLISLKAELARKQEEAQRNKGSVSYIRPVPRKKKTIKGNAGVEERSAKDELSQEEVDLLKKSKDVLQVKAKLYDRLQKGESVQEDGGNSYLVDFKEKVDKVFSESPVCSTNDEIEDDYSDEDDGWVEYVDCLGRTRKCLKEDLDKIKERDAEMKGSLGGEEELKEESTEQPELMSQDMQREKMREKWEEQERLLMNKKNIYYEDIRFDEARSHGVAYYRFSTDDTKREEERAEFKKMREETQAKQREAKDAKERRDAMKQARLMAARQRQRERLGLPPLSTDVEIEDKVEVVQEKEETIMKDDTLEDLEAAMARAAHVRPWDVGKDGVKEFKTMSQEEWVEKKRDERPQEFAPPQFDDNHKGKKRKFNNVNDSSSSNDVIGPLPDFMNINRTQDFPSFTKNKKIFSNKGSSSNTNYQSHFNSESSTESKFNVTYADGSKEKSKGAAIPPPLSFDYYNPNRPKTKISQSSNSTIESIEAGLEYIKKQSEKREKLAEKKNSDL